MIELEFEHWYLIQEFIFIITLVLPEKYVK